LAHKAQTLWEFAYDNKLGKCAALWGVSLWVFTHKGLSGIMPLNPATRTRCRGKQFHCPAMVVQAAKNGKITRFCHFKAVFAQNRRFLHTD
jgi:hypothetical protein